MDALWNSIVLLISVRAPALDWQSAHPKDLEAPSRNRDAREDSCELRSGAVERARGRGRRRSKEANHGMNFFFFGDGVYVSLHFRILALACFDIARREAVSFE